MVRMTGKRARCVAPMLAVILVSSSACSVFGGSSAPGKNVSTFKLKPGECVVPPAQVKAELSSLRVVGCTQPHTEETYAVVSYTGAGADRGSTYPGDAVLTKFANGICAERYQGYVGVAYPDSSLFFTYLLPSPRSWQVDDRSIVCLVTTTGQQLKKSVKNSRL